MIVHDCRRANEQETESPERRLWLAVLVQAFDDLHSSNVWRRREAENFLFASDKDFSCVCSSAGIDPSSFSARLTKMKALIPAAGIGPRLN